MFVCSFFVVVCSISTVEIWFCKDSCRIVLTFVFVFCFCFFWVFVVVVVVLVCSFILFYFVIFLFYLYGVFMLGGKRCYPVLRKRIMTS